MSDEKITGFLNVDKPAGMTSHDVVSQVRKIAKRTSATKKVGHAGTLDPMATGVLILCLGNATRLSEYAMQSTKHYRARVRLGIVTDTYDAEGEIIEEKDASHITPQDIEALLPQFTGDIKQVPPMYSAIKQGGKKLYELARAGKEVEREPRPVTIISLEISEWQPPEFTLEISCSAGTYIRSLAYDIGNELGVGAHLSGLVRTRSGAFTVDDAVSLETLKESENLEEHIILPQNALADWKAIHLTPAQVDHISNGRMIENDTNLPDRYVMAYTPENKLLAVLRNQVSHWKPHKVFSD